MRQLDEDAKKETQDQAVEEVNRKMDLKLKTGQRIEVDSQQNSNAPGQRNSSAMDSRMSTRYRSS